ncbi:MAG: class I SAM-dependent methyltransferase [Planctomycetota bacterium]|jgi:ubiquinone/menaquinone biosynthesis C-methylase UbiE
MERRAFWDRYLRAYDALNLIEDYRVYLDRIVADVGLRPGERVLDAGSGTGNLSIRMQAEDARVVSLDFSPVALAAHRRKDPSAEQVRASLEAQLPLSDSSFDVVTCTSVLPVLSEDGVDLALRELRRVLRPGGRLVITASRKGLSKCGCARRHMAARLKDSGIWGFFREMRSTLWPLLRLAYYNIRVYRLRKQQSFRRFTREDILARVADAGFVRLRHDLTFGGLFHLVLAETPSGVSEGAHVDPGHMRDDACVRAGVASGTRTVLL